jgi:hypothetical protein
LPVNEVVMPQPVRFLVATIALLSVALLIPSPSFGQNGRNANRRARRNALMASRPYTPIAAGAGVVGNRTQANPADVQAVTQAYKLLAQADHDYQGHRIKAMKHLHQAGKVLGINLQGDGKTSSEAQGNSDSQLKQAQTMLHQMTSNSVSGKRHQRALQHVNSALSELNTALSIK